MIPRRPHRPFPASAGGLSGVIALSPGSDHSLALEKDGTVWQWGGGLWQDGTSVIRATLFADQGLANVGEIAAAVPSRV